MVKPSAAPRGVTLNSTSSWREAVKPLPGIERITINPRRGGPPGRDIDIRLRGGSPETLKAAANELKATLARFPGVSDVEDDLPYGKQEVLLSVTPRGAALGFTDITGIRGHKLDRDPGQMIPRNRQEIGCGIRAARR